MGLRDRRKADPMSGMTWDEYTGLLIIYTSLVLVLTYTVFAIFQGWYGLSISFDDAWETKGSMLDGLIKVWPMFAWGAGTTLLFGLGAIIRRKPREEEPGYTFVKGTWISLNAGFFEELLHRWMGLFGALFILKLVNTVTFGLTKWIYVHGAIPFANWITFGLLEPQLHSSQGWLFAAAILSANGKFQEGHKYLGLLGWVNSWFIGMVMFYLVFNYGLWTAIVAHIVYDLCIFWIEAAVSVFQPRDPLRNPKAAVQRALLD